jgi:phosphatidylserine/phosphatidylglycerophosphate/cardiolipin synthase-like enzyme
MRAVAACTAACNASCNTARLAMTLRTQAARFFTRTIALYAALLLALVWVPTPSQARTSVNVSGTVDAYFTPGDDAESAIAQTLQQAREEVLVLAYTFTNKKIAEALLAAHKRGVSVRVIADPDQMNRTAAQKVSLLAKNGIPVLLDKKHQAQHNKVMVIDARTVITGSFNFTVAAQRHNAENVLILRNQPALAKAYVENWRKLAAGAEPLR